MCALFVYEIMPLVKNPIVHCWTRLKIICHGTLYIETSQLSRTLHWPFVHRQPRPYNVGTSISVSRILIECISSCFSQEFVMGLSVLSRGTLQERLQWAFNLYDINGDGFITKDEMTDIVSAIYEMMGRFSEPMVDENTTKEHVERVFHVSSIRFLCTKPCSVLCGTKQCYLM